MNYIPISVSEKILRQATHVDPTQCYEILTSLIDFKLRYVNSLEI